MFAPKDNTMPQSDSVSKALASAKSELASSYKKIPPMSTTPTPSPAAQPKSPAPVTKPPSISDELAAKKANVDQYTASLPKLHRGGEVKADGAYQLKKGEHVLTPKEAKVAHKHALMMSGLKSMAKSYTAGDSQKAEPVKTVAKSGNTVAKGPATKGQPVKIDAKLKGGASKSATKTPPTIRPEKNQAAKVPQQMER